MNLEAPTQELLEQAHEQVRARTDRLFAGLMSIQWLAGVFAALLLSPLAWDGATSRVHLHVWAAFFLGAAIAGPPIALALTRAGKRSTGYAIAVGQMLTSGLFIHLSGGRIETHFHIFVSLALLAFYRDPRILLTASAVVAVDHVLRGMFWPQSIYGVLAASPWRAVEHALWVVFEDSVLFLAIRDNLRDMQASAEQRAQLESSRRIIEQDMLARTHDLRESEARYRSLSNSSPIGIFETDALGRCVFTNPQWQDIFGLTLEESLGDGWSAPVHEDDRQHIFDGWHSSTSRSEPFDREFRVRTPAGDEHWVHTRAAAINDESGSVTGYVGTVEDITRQKKDEIELVRAREAALSTARLKSEFLANMSHEIRTPLNGVIGMTELTLETDLTREQREYLETARSSADALLTVIEDILDFSKIEAGKLELDPIPTDLGDLVNTTLKTLGLRAEKKGIELVSHIRPGVPDRVLLDPGRLRQVLLNLLGNALKFTAEGEVVVKIETESVSDAELTLHFCVSDTGIGIPLDKQALIFESFTQADQSTTRRFGGTGLGLAITSRLVALMGGRVWVESEPERGSRFHFTIQAGVAAGASPAMDGEADAATALRDLRGLRVLVVDDNETNRRVLTELLTHWQMTSCAAEDGSSALAQMASARASGTPFDLVLLDGRMPEMDGFDVAKRIRESPEMAAATLMMLTSGGQVGDAERCRELGMAGYLVKPVAQAELIAAIRAALPGDAGLGAARPAEPAAKNSWSTAPGRRGLHVLVAEDNAVNQLVAVRLLEKLGHTSVVAENGVRALQALEHERFDLILMDVQMPVMGGLETTVEIRAREHAGGTGAHIPILGLTAHAMKAELDKCMASGMDAFVTKPIKVPVLVAAMEHLLAPVAQLEATSTPAPDHSEDPRSLLDLEQARENACGDLALLAEIARIFRTESVQQLVELEAGLAALNASAIEHTAHRLRGSLSTLGAVEAAAAAGRLEHCAADGDLSGVATLAAALEREIAGVRPQIEELESEGRKAA